MGPICQKFEVDWDRSGVLEQRSELRPARSEEDWRVSPKRTREALFVLAFLPCLQDNERD
jgi:hypothetical protein